MIALRFPQGFFLYQCPQKREKQQQFSALTANKSFSHSHAE